MSTVEVYEVRTRLVEMTDSQFVHGIEWKHVADSDKLYDPKSYRDKETVKTITLHLPIYDYYFDSGRRHVYVAMRPEVLEVFNFKEKMIEDLRDKIREYQKAKWWIRLKWLFTGVKP